MIEPVNGAALLGGRRFELIDGDLIDKTGQSLQHAGAIRLLHAWLARVSAAEQVQMRLPIDVAVTDRELNEPEPDVCVLAEANPEHARRHPGGDETLLMVEVADSSIRADSYIGDDTVTKRDLSRAGVPEYWVVNLADRELIVHRRLNQGRYHEVTTLAEDAAAALACRPGKSVKVAMLLP